MRFDLRRSALTFLGSAVLLSCTDTLSSPRATPGAARRDVVATLPSVRFSEIHYDNTGTDVGEAIEISGPAGTDLTGWKIVLYNGSGGASYDTKTLSGAIPATCGTRGVIVQTYPSNGIQNGSPDGVALVNAGGTVIEFLSYEGPFAATDGPAAGTTSVDIGVSEAGTEAVGMSLQRDGSNAWSGPKASTFGACNDADVVVVGPLATITVSPSTATIANAATQQFTAAGADALGHPVTATVTWTSNTPAVATIDATTGLATAKSAGDATISATSGTIVGTATLHVTSTVTPPGNVHISELHYDNTGTDAGEAIEVFGPAGTNLTGWSIVLYDGNGGTVYNTTTLSGAIPATCGANGVIVVNYPENGIQNGSPDGIALVDASANVVEFISYEGAFAATAGPASGKTSVDIGVSEASTAPIGTSLQRDNGTGIWSASSAATFGACNTATTVVTTSISFSGRLSTDPPLPLGFEDQLFATEHDASNNTVNTTFTWKAETPALATIDANGVMHALAEGTATFRATATDGTTATFSLPMAIATASTTANYGNNTEFGDPTDADPSDDFIIRRPQYTTSYNKNRGTPNWVAYDLDASQFGSNVDRCDCFTFDPALPASFTHYTTADYTGAGAFAGFGIDRGHMTRSFDRTAGTLDNANTYYFSNVVPQAADLNQGPWAILENFLGDLARTQNKEVYIVAGVAGNAGTVKGEGKIVIPASTWKIAVIMPRDQGLANVHDYRDLEVIAVNMPNQAGVRNVDWHTYITTVDAIEALTGYDFLSLLPDNIERAVESNTKPPIASVNGPFTSAEGSSVSMSGAASLDPNGSILSYAWSFGDGATGTGVGVAHTYAQDGDYTVRLIVTDNDALVDTVKTTAHVTNVAPVISAFAGATLFPGETYSASGSFTDPGADPWTATVNYGDGSATSPLALVGKTFALSHVYTTAGTFTVTVRVSDDDATTTATQTVVVTSPAQGVQSAMSVVNGLVDAGKLNAGNGNSLTQKLDAALKQIDAGKNTPAVNQLNAMLNEVDALVKTGRLAATDADAMRAIVQRVIASLTR
jgi:DNA/RNA endonuclease G (NUC1)